MVNEKKKIIIVKSCGSCPHFGLTNSTIQHPLSIIYCKENLEKIEDKDGFLEDCPLDVLDTKKIIRDINDERRTRDRLKNYIEENFETPPFETSSNEELPDEWKLLKGERVFDLFPLKKREIFLLKELIHVLKIHVLNDDDKIEISKKIFHILQNKLFQVI